MRSRQRLGDGRIGFFLFFFFFARRSIWHVPGRNDVRAEREQGFLYIPDSTESTIDVEDFLKYKRARGLTDWFASRQTPRRMGDYGTPLFLFFFFFYLLSHPQVFASSSTEGRSQVLSTSRWRRRWALGWWDVSGRTHFVSSAWCT